MEPLDRFTGGNAHALGLKHDGRAIIGLRDRWKQLGFEEKRVVVQEEMKRVTQLPARSTYATHRLRVLNKILQLLSIERTASAEEELELLFAGLSL